MWMEILKGEDGDQEMGHLALLPFTFFRLIATTESVVSGRLSNVQEKEFNSYCESDV